jgi:hypothetical protein
MIIEDMKLILMHLRGLEEPSVPEWYTLSEAAKPRSPYQNGLDKHPERHPDRAEAELVNGRRRWQQHVILRWLLRSDEKLKQKCERMLMAV